MSACAIYFYNKANSKDSSDTVAQSDDQKIIDSVKKLIMLPEGEVPTIATVSNLEKLKGQLFFDKAKLGDKVLIYVKAQKAYLYDPVDDRILEVAPILIENSQSNDQNIATTSKVKIKSKK